MAENTGTIYDFTAKDIDLKDVPMKEFKGKVVLISNVASKCGKTNINYVQMQELYTKYQGRGFEILGFPSSQFFQELPTNQEIKDFVSDFGVTFRMMDKVHVNGSEAHPLWTFLKDKAPDGWFTMIKWNFTKFLVDRNGVPFKRYGTTVDPAEIEKDIVALLEKDPASGPSSA